MFTFASRDETEKYIITTFYKSFKIQSSEKTTLRYSYFFFLTQHKDAVQNVLANKGYSMIYSPINNNDTISYFVITEDASLYQRGENYISYLVMCHLLEYRIPIIIIGDDGGVIYTRNEIRDYDAIIEYRHDIPFAAKSVWEANIARMLDYLSISYEYEKTSFARVDPNNESIKGYYVPDFFLANNHIIEVKGFWDPGSRYKTKEFEKSYTNYHLHIIDNDLYCLLDKAYKNIIPFWEPTRISTQLEIIPIVGITIAERIPFIRQLKQGDAIILERDKNNKYDRNAIKALDCSQNMLGFIASEWALIYAYKIDLGLVLSANVLSVEDKKINIKVKPEYKQSNPTFIINNFISLLHTNNP